MNNVTIETYDRIAKDEPSIEASSLLVELLPCMEEFFIGDISFDGQAIVYRMPNGQSFRITAHKA